MEQPQLEACLSCGEREPRQRVEGGHVGTQRADVAGQVLHRETRRSSSLELIAASDEICARGSSQ
jgi:hypothetical protein